jgi:4-amino-4-deoxy-L-arabinose transferase-like glycosyltransferase
MSLGAVGRRGLLLAWAVVMLGLHAWLALRAADRMAPTFDEPLHIVGGYLYDAKGDFRLHPENGVLPQRWAAWPLTRMDLKLPMVGYDAAWRSSDIAALSTAFLYDVGNDSAAIVAAARRQAVWWSLALGVLVFGWAWSLWGAGGAALSVGLFALSPTTLAHGPLVTSDMSAALMLTLACWAWWRHLQSPSLGNLLLSAGIAALAAIAKFSAALLPPLFLILGAWMLWQRPVWRLRAFGERALSGTLPRLAWIAVAIVVHTVVAFAVIWAAFDFRFAAASPEMPAMAQYYRLWSHAMPEGTVGRVLEAMRGAQLLPEPYLYGFGFVLRFAEARAAFLNGEHGISGWWWYFPYAFLVKSSLAELLATLGVSVAGVTAWRRAGGSFTARIASLPAGVVPLLAFLLVYAGFSVTSNLNIGHRHLLPVYPVLFILAGGLVASGAATWRRGIAVAALALSALELARIHPHHLAYFNGLVGGPSQGWRHLVDSSLDWGQDAPALGAWLARERRPGEAVYHSVFGQRRMAAYGVYGTEIAPVYTDVPRRSVPWGPGIYAVSATMLQDVYSPFAGPWTGQNESNFQVLARNARRDAAVAPDNAIIGTEPVVGNNYWTFERLNFARLVNYLRLRRPDAVLEHTIFVHRLTDAEARTIREGDTPAYVALLDSAR